MGTPERETVAGVDQPAATLALLRAAAREGFFAVVGLLERLTPDAARIGANGPAQDEAIRFKHDPALSFSAADVTSVELAAPPADPFAASQARPRYELTATFLGLTGAASPLPLHLIEEVLGEERAVQRDFLDLFHHRLLSLLFRLVMKYDAPAEYLSDASDEWSKRMLALGGTDVYGDVKPKLPVWRLLRLGSLLVSRTRNARTLELALADILAEEIGGARIDVEEFVGAWVTLEAPQLTRLGRANHTLGRDLILGKQVYDRSGKFRVRFSQLDGATYARLLPEGDLHPQVKEIIGRMLDDPLAYELELVLAMGAVPAFELSAAGRTRLGHNTWLGGRAQGETRVVVDVVT